MAIASPIPAVFHEVAAPTIEELQALLAKIITRIMRWLTKQGFLIEEQDPTYLAETEQATEPACDHAQAQGAPARMSWTRLLKRVFDIDIDHCPNCGGSLKIIAAIEDPSVIGKILSHLGLPPAPRRARTIKMQDFFWLCATNALEKNA